MSSSRVVAVDLRAEVRGFVVGIKQAQQSVKDLKSEVEKSAKDNSAQMTQVGVAFTGVGLAAAAAAGVAITKWATFDQAMSNVQAATHESAGAMKSLSDAALDAGARTVFSATEAAGAIEELAKAGVSTADILGGGLDGALDLAAAGGLGVAEAAGIAATALKTFGLEGRDMSHVADLLAAGAGKAMGDVTDLSSALNQSAMVANATGLSIEETTATLAAFASQGLLGSDAGTSFKSMLQSLTPTSAKARETMDQLGISAYDAQGNFIGMAEFAGKLQAGLKDLTVEQQQAALKTIFGSDAIRAATVLYSEGAEGINEWIDAVDDQGYAAETAAARLDNLMGDIEALGGALDTALIKTGSGANDVLRSMVQILTDAVDAYSQLPPEMQGVILAGTLLAAGVGLIGGAFLLAVPKIVEFNAAMTTLRTDMPRTTAAVGAASSALAVLAAIQVGAAVASWIDDIRDVTASASDLESQLRKTGDAGAELERGLTGGNAMRGLGLDAQYAEDNLRALDTWVGRIKAGFDNSTIGQAMSVSMLGLGREVGNAQKQIEELDAALAALVASGDTDAAAAGYANFAETAERAGWSAERIAEALPKYKQAQADATSATDDATGAADENAEAVSTAAGALLEQADAADAATSELESLVDALSEANGVAQEAEGANARYQQALSDVAEYIQNAQAGVDGYSTSLDANTVEGSKNRDMLAGLAADSQAAALAIFEQETSTLGAEQATANYRDRLNQGRESLINQITALTGNYDAAVALADSIYAIPDDHTTNIMAETALASEQVRRFIAGLPQTFTVFGNVQWGQTAQNASSALNHASGGTVGRYDSGGTIPGFGGGVLDGTVYGRGTSKSDSVMVRLSKGEEVIQEPYATMNRTLLKQINSGMFRGYAGGGTIDGRYVQYAPPGRGPSAGGQPVVQQVPTELVVRDVDGALIGRMQVEAAQVVNGASRAGGSRVSRGTDRRF